MKRVSINHSLDGRAINKGAMVLFVLGLCFFIGSAAYLRQLTLLSESLTVQIESHRMPGVISLQSNSQDNAAKLDEMKAVNTAVVNILLPWPVLFEALEQAQDNQQPVKLLVVEPKMQDEMMKITAIAFSVASMLDYMKRLNQHDMLNLVDLISTESVEVNGQPATQFNLAVSW
ncbi:MAG: hypothetical protein COA90_04980 [Gammaproteobacteria bacterium]|nr:MAG: hypothetical protein COA90_04980 [Gammaproteobacteria bacterium]